MTPLSRRLIAELLGTLLLVAFGTASVVVNAQQGAPLGLGGIALTWGALVAVLVYAFGNLSGTQINPAVTVGLWSVGRLPRGEVLPHVVAQVIGASIGSFAVLWLLGDSHGLGATTTALDPARAFAVEFAASFLLMACVMGAGVDERTPRGFVALGAGMAVMLDVFVAGPLTGASMNPARSFGPALAMGAWTMQWLYWVAPIAGMLAAAQVMQRLGSPPNGPLP